MAEIQDLISATNNGQLVFSQPGDRRVLTHIANNEPIGGSVVHLNQALIELLAALSAAGTVTVMSLYRRGQGPHGKIGRNGEITCRAVDIESFAGLPVSLRNRENAVRVVANLIRLFPAGNSFDIGFPRPVGGPTGFNAAQDVFFPVRDEATARRCYAGTISLPMREMLEPAKTQILQAMSSSGADFRLNYPDGLNHLHIKAYRLDPVAAPADAHQSHGRHGKGV